MAYSEKDKRAAQGMGDETPPRSFFESQKRSMSSKAKRTTKRKAKR